MPEEALSPKKRVHGAALGYVAAPGAPFLTVWENWF